MLKKNTLDSLLSMFDAEEIVRTLMIEAQLDKDVEDGREAEAALAYAAAYIALRHEGMDSDLVEHHRFKGFNDTELRSIVFGLDVARQGRFLAMNNAHNAGDHVEERINSALYTMAVQLHEEAELTLEEQLEPPDTDNATVRKAVEDAVTDDDETRVIELPAMLRNQAE